MRTPRTVILVFGLMILASGAFGASTDNHTVTVTIPTINELAISGGNLTLTFIVPTAGSDPSDVSDATTCDLAWSTNEASQKITVASNIASPVASLKVTATGVTGGTAAAQVTLTTTTTDFVTGIALGTGGCDLSYTASCTAGQTAGSEVHTVTYTITTT